ncbi:MAG: glycoside hydrolase family 43 protein [Bacteroidales bacterium]|nr:glycoside hydrolase family 43 protein [Bacteroidales bacterium]
MTFKHIKFLLISFILIAGNILAENPGRKGKSFFSFLTKESPAYLFSYFTGNGEDGLHLMYSFDGIIWKTLNNGQSFLKPMVGKSKLMRDPSIVQDAKGTFHMVWTTGLSENNIGYASSKDLISWSEQKEIPVMAKEPAVKDTRAPELFYKKSSKTFYIIWSSTIPGHFSETANKEEGNNHRLYYTTTRDFKTFTDTKLFYDPKFSVTDACIFQKRGLYYLFLKNETEVPVEKNIRYAVSGNIKQFPTTVSVPISGKKWAEGPSAIQIGDYTYVYWDIYHENHSGGARCKNIRKPEWENITDMLRFPAGAKNGNVFKIDNNTLIKLQHLEKQ